MARIPYEKAASLYEDLLKSIVDKVESKEEVLDALNNLDHPNALAVDCIHCSTGFNNNDHFFIPSELYAARETAVNQLADWMHDRKQIVGCISETQIKDFDGEPVTFEDDEEIALEEEFDLHAEIVVWAREKEEYAIKVLELHNDGKLAVSMETTFDDYDFALEKDGVTKIVKRNKETAFLKEHMRRNGGSGKYKGFRVGIAFRDIKFTGVGFIDRNEVNPANVRSEVTDVKASHHDEEKKKVKKKKKSSEKSEKIVDSLDCNGVTKSAAAICENKGENRMEFEKLYEEAKAKLEAAEDSKKELEAKAEEATSKVVDLEKEVADLKADAAEVRTYSRSDNGENEHTYVAKDWDGNDVQVTEHTVYTNKSVTTVTEELMAEATELKEKLADAQAKLDEIEVQRKQEERKAAIAELDVEIEEEELFAMSDEEYSAMIKFAPKKQEEVAEEDAPAKEEAEDKEETEEKEEETSEEEEKEDEEASEEEEKDEDEVAAEEGVEKLEETEEEEEQNVNEAEAAEERNAKNARTAVAQLLI